MLHDTFRYTPGDSDPDAPVPGKRLMRQQAVQGLGNQHRRHHAGTYWMPTAERSGGVKWREPS